MSECPLPVLAVPVYNYCMIYHTDGYMMGKNPSYIGGGYTICDQEQRVVKTEAVYTNGRRYTNNEAELTGVYVCARDFCNIGDTIITDSQIIRAWVRSGRPKARPDLAWMARECKNLIFDKKLKLIWRPREENFAGWYNELRPYNPFENKTLRWIV